MRNHEDHKVSDSQDDLEAYVQDRLKRDPRFRKALEMEMQNFLPPHSRTSRGRQGIQLTAIVERQGDAFHSHCPELDIASQGVNPDEARANLLEAVHLFLQAASPNEIVDRLRHEVSITSFTVQIPS